MSFDLKYDRDGRPIAPKEEPKFIEEQPVAVAPEEIVEPVAEETVVDDANTGLNVLAQDSAEEVQKQPKEPETSPEIQPTTPRMDKRLKVLMDKAQRMERERNEAMQRLQQMERESASAKWNAETQRTYSEQMPDEDVNIGPDDLAEGKHLSKMQNKMRKMEETLKSYQQQSATNQAQALLRSKHPDFEKVVSAENVAVLKELHPEIYQTLSSNNDLYSTGSSAYTIIKNLGIHVEDVYQQDRAKIQANAIKPKSLATISPQRGESPLSQANAFSQGLTPALQKQLIEEMQAARKGL